MRTNTVAPSLDRKPPAVAPEPKGMAGASAGTARRGACEAGERVDTPAPLAPPPPLSPRRGGSNSLGASGEAFRLCNSWKCWASKSRPRAMLLPGVSPPDGLRARCSLAAAAGDISERIGETISNLSRVAMPPWPPAASVPPCILCHKRCSSSTCGCSGTVSTSSRLPGNSSCQKACSRMAGQPARSRGPLRSRDARRDWRAVERPETSGIGSHKTICWIC
mmetsp:Transcript_85273/g.231432  ORF Transcript_85273/g.231432 Transcript_85273/m.231432 type:complete len:221 (-) Transcript_85273:67-729(-)